MAQALIDGITNYWCRTKGIQSKDLEKHPQIDDVILLINYRDAMWDKLTRNEQSFWGALWNISYVNKFALKRKHLKKLEIITVEANKRHLAKIITEAKTKQRIRQLRQTV